MQISTLLTPEEIKAIMVALGQVIEDMIPMVNDPRWNKEAKKDMADILRYSKSAQEKISKTSGLDVVVIAAYKDGDENEFITRQS